MSLRDSILSADDLPREAVPVPEWKGITVWVRTLTGAERDAFEATVNKGRKDAKSAPNLANFRARLVCLCLCDELGTRLFADADAEALGRKSAAALDRIADVCLRLNRMTPAAQEELEKNSETTPSGSSASA